MMKKLFILLSAAVAFSSSVNAWEGIYEFENGDGRETNFSRVTRERGGGIKLENKCSKSGSDSYEVSASELRWPNSFHLWKGSNYLGTTLTKDIDISGNLTPAEFLHELLQVGRVTKATVDGVNQPLPSKGSFAKKPVAPTEESVKVAKKRAVPAKKPVAPVAKKKNAVKVAKKKNASFSKKKKVSVVKHKNYGKKHSQIKKRRTRR